MNNSAADVVVYNTTLNRLEQENAALQVANDALKAHINSLREALHYLVVFEHAVGTGSFYQTTVAEKLLNQTPTQSLAEHDRKVIAEFRMKCEG